MKNDDFDKLVKSVKQAGKIRRGKMQPSHMFEIRPADIKAIRERHVEPHGLTPVAPPHASSGVTRRSISVFAKATPDTRYALTRGLTSAAFCEGG